MSLICPCPRLLVYTICPLCVTLMHTACIHTRCVWTRYGMKVSHSCIQPFHTAILGHIRDILAILGHIRDIVTLMHTTIPYCIHTCLTHAYNHSILHSYLSIAFILIYSIYSMCMNDAVWNECKIHTCIHSYILRECKVHTCVHSYILHTCVHSYILRHKLYTQSVWMRYEMSVTHTHMYTPTYCATNWEWQTECVLLQQNVFSCTLIHTAPQTESGKRAMLMIHARYVCTKLN